MSVVPKLFNGTHTPHFRGSKGIFPVKFLKLLLRIPHIVQDTPETGCVWPISDREGHPGGVRKSGRDELLPFVACCFSMISASPLKAGLNIGSAFLVQTAATLSFQRLQNSLSLVVR